jgi:tyrosine-protein phosphatase SIW14
MRRVLRFVPPVLVAIAVVGLPYAYSQVRERHLRNFRVVEDGVLYRSAQLSPAGLERVIHDYGIKTVVSFRDTEEGKNPEPPDKWEEAFCAKLGVNYVRMPLRTWQSRNGAVPADENVKHFLNLLADPKNRPVLAHCFRGVHRTGTYCAIYRMECDGWSNEEAIDELKALGYDNLDKEEDVHGYLEHYVPGRRRSPGQ